MRLLNNIATAAVLAFGVTSAAHATYTATHITTSDPYAFTLTAEKKDGMAIESAKLSMYFADLYDLFGATNETVTVKLDNVFVGTVSNVSFSGDYYGFNVLPSMLGNGKLAVSLSVGCNKTVFGYCISEQDVWLKHALLTVNHVQIAPVDGGTPPATPREVPEPATLLTLGVGMLGLAATRRRRA
ncbi:MULTISPECIES: PEP-CTERM sorting domain-containing protein [unclassified Massilia]|uniref:PEP-CTERM sorting domain-containing protein n=1 Tax=unclassified Massilia TaxID=2609279 RepID=UPI0017810D84|nr:MULTISPECIES: PEP-CTERM sorting domain-containing protein [unclassified Massilia]MBD8532790.1 PEP-CTERM sorting domain-containing protein [Massilia sp. CFBP 13647]MBD8676093.1 PEP-CTERM sorting domain-containing protein [Massilia sp. CFBP 13721]